MGLNATYQKEMHDQLGFFATWLPGETVELGDAGILEGGRFRKMASLSELGIASHVGPSGTPHPVRYQSTTGAGITARAGANAQRVGKGNIDVSFSREGAFIFHALGLQEQKLEERLSLFGNLVSSYEAGLWQDSWLLVEAVYRVERATILVAADASAQLSLEVTGDLPVDVNLADADVKFSVAARSGRLLEVWHAQNVQPLYSCVRVQKRILAMPTVQPVRGVNSPLDDSERAIRPGIAELINS